MRGPALLVLATLALAGCGPRIGIRPARDRDDFMRSHGIKGSPTDRFLGVTDAYAYKEIRPLRVMGPRRSVLWLPAEELSATDLAELRARESRRSASGPPR